ncbi:MAG TPA: hypothetical protein DCM28_12075 [Phycisphaerales bacterium]|nr:hypothetical protein [Phycisphaerales bacterium]HCD31378.1 hypothetical protein [Phycisphaerales bacterium]|tara:strand:- start:145975 stop:146487 length:513 start_codon:yes stop_codon:yes gene_type:complete
MSEEQEEQIPEQDDEQSEGVPQPEADNMLLIVTGAHLRAEIADRPLAYDLQDQILQWLDDNADVITGDIFPVVCSDIWYINQQHLHGRPTISIGGPGVNGLSAYLTQRLTPALIQDGRKIIQLDPDFVDLRACVWGMDHDLTIEALDTFIDRYLTDYLKAVLTQVEPHED